MTTTDYLFAAVLILLVIPQIRGTRLTLRTALPIVVVAVAATHYMKSVPTQGHDVPLDVLCMAAGALLGVGCALTSRIARGADGVAIAKAGAAAAALWII